MTDIATAPDLSAIKQRQQATWASGDYHMIGTQILIVSALLRASRTRGTGRWSQRPVRVPAQVSR